MKNQLFKGLLLLATVFFLTSCGWYQDYNREQELKNATNEGQAMYLKSENSKKTMIETAKAKLEAAKLDAQSEVVRAEGIAKANKIIGQSLNNNRSYLEWLWIDNIEKNQNAVFYIPTENKVPIMNFSNPKVSKVVNEEDK
jgi:hypothetical protein